VSVGHLARIIEMSGIPTVIIAVDAFRNRLEKMRVPRLITTPHIMGRPVGLPGDVRRQRAVLLNALHLLSTAETGNTIVTIKANSIS